MQLLVFQTSGFLRASITHAVSYNGFFKGKWYYNATTDSYSWLSQMKLTMILVLQTDSYNESQLILLGLAELYIFFILVVTTRSMNMQWAIFKFALFVMSML